MSNTRFRPPFEGAIKGTVVQIIIEVGIDEFIVLTGKRIKTQRHDTVYPFHHAATFQLDARSAARIGQNTITVSEAELLIDAAADWKEISVATVPVFDVPVVDVPYIEPSQLTLWESES